MWIPIGILLVATLPMPYSYYMILRLVIPIFSILIVINSLKKEQKNNFHLIFGGITILYNPIFPISLTKEIWIALNILSAGTFFYYLVNSYKNNN